MPLNFPSNPAVNDQYTFGGRTWVWNGSAWDSYNPGISGYVSALNGFTGGVTLAAGTGITLTNTSNTITIATIVGVGATGPTGPQGNTGATGPVGDYVISFNGATGAVTGVTTGTTNTFTALQTFSNGLVATGATLSGTVAISGLSTPNADSDAANKAYVDNVASVGVHYHTAVVLASTDTETFASGVTYSNGTLGVGATLTKTTPFARLNIDSTDGVTADRILIRSATTQQWNGVYDVTDQGSASNAWILTRSADADNYHPYFNDGLGANDYFFVSSGASLKNNAYICSTPNGITFGTTAITFALFSTPPVYTAGTGLALNSLQFSNTGVLSFNGLTGAVTGVTTSVANTFTALQTFNSGLSASGATFTGIAAFLRGITASGATFMGNINLQNAEFIRNTTNGRIDFMPAPAAANAYGMYMDFTGWGFGTKLGTIRSSDNVTNVGGFLWDAALVTGNDVDFSFGANQAYKIRTTATNNNYKTLQLGLPAGTVGYSSALAIMDYANAGSSSRQPNTVHTHPNVYIYSAGVANPNDFIRIEHDRTNANIVTGQTSGILIQPGSGWLGVSGGISASGGVTFASKVNAIQGVVSGYPRLEWCGLTSGFDIIPTGWQNMSAPISTSPTANDAYFAPIFISSRIRVTGIGHQTGTNGSGNTGSFILGLYDSDNFGYPRNRLYASAQTTLSTSAFASQRLTGVNTTVNPGQYWLAITFSAASIPVAGLGRLGTRMKFMTPTSSSPIGQASVDGLRRPQGGFTLAATQGTTFANVEGPDNPCIFYNGEFI